MTNTLILRPKSGIFEKDFDTFGKMDPFIRVTIGKDVQRTETALNKSKTPTWKTPLSFKLTSQQVNQPETVTIFFEAFDEDPGSNEFLGSATFKLSQFSSYAEDYKTIKLYDRKNNYVGSIEVEFDLKLAPGQIAERTSPPKLKNYRRIIGAVIIRPLDGRLDIGVNDKQEIYLVFIHGDVAFQTEVGMGTGRKPIFDDLVCFQLFDSENMVVRCFDNDPKKNDMIGEATINFPYLLSYSSAHKLSLPLISDNLRVGEINVEVEFLEDRFESPVKVYPTLSIKSGGFVSKKIQYSNPDRFPKTFAIRSHNENVIHVKSENVTILPGEFGEIRLKIFGPNRGEVKNCIIDVMVEDTRVVEESLFFKIKGVDAGAR